VTGTPFSAAASQLARRVKAAALGAGRRLNPLRRLPGRLTAYRDRWRSRAVADQMVALAERELERPEEVAPYRSFRELLGPLAADPALPVPARFLDMGCGAGAYGELLERWAPGRFAYTGADYAQEVVDAARARWPGREFVRRDLFEPHALDGYDVVFASALVDVLAQYEEALEALCASDARWLFLHRQRIGRRARVDVARGYPGQHTYRSYVAQPQLEEVARRHERRLAASARVDADVRSFLLVRD